MSMAELVLDLETKKSFDDVGGRNNHHLLGVSLAGVYDYGNARFFALEEKDMAELERLITQADRIIGFNTKNFDYAVLQPYVSLNLNAVPSLDIMEEIVKVLGHRVSLDSVASATLGTKKTGDGLKAIQLFREGKMLELAEYCLQDVKLTRDIYEYGAEHGKLFFDSRFGGTKEISVSWKKIAAHEAPLRLAL